MYSWNFFNFMKKITASGFTSLNSSNNFSLMISFFKFHQSSFSSLVIKTILATFFSFGIFNISFQMNKSPNCSNSPFKSSLKPGGILYLYRSSPSSIISNCSLKLNFSPTWCDFSKSLTKFSIRLIILESSFSISSFSSLIMFL